MLSTVSRWRALWHLDTGILAALNTRSLNELEAGTHSNLLATRDNFGTTCSFTCHQCSKFILDPRVSGGISTLLAVYIGFGWPSEFSSNWWRWRFAASNGWDHNYLSTSINRFTDIPSRQCLCSASTKALIVPKCLVTVGVQVFLLAATKLWNKLPWWCHFSPVANCLYRLKLFYLKLRTVTAVHCFTG